MYREGVRCVAGVALATPFFRFYFIKLSKKILKIVLKILLNYYYLLLIYTYTYICLYYTKELLRWPASQWNVSKMSPNVSIETFPPTGYTNLKFLTPSLMWVNLFETESHFFVWDRVSLLLFETESHFFFVSDRESTF